MARYDVIFVGGGINSLVGAAILARAGWEVCVLERNPVLGGNLCTEELTVPGFHHDVLAGWHPLFVGSAGYAELAPELTAAGLTYLNTEYPTGALLDNGESIFLSTSADRNREEFDRFVAGDGSAWQAAIDEFMGKAGISFGLLGTELWSVQGLRLLWDALRGLGKQGSLEFGSELLSTGRHWLQENFRGRQLGALLAPWILHTGLSPDSAGSGFMIRVMAAAFQLGGMPIPQGGGARLVTALETVIRNHGGAPETGQHVARILVRDGQAVGVLTLEGREITASRAVVCSVTPQQLYLDLLGGSEAPPRVVERARRFRYGRADMQIHLALSEPPAWPGGDERFLKTAIVHCCDGVDSVSRAVNQAERGLLPSEATIVVGQPMALDPSRGPEGSWIIWIQLQELPRHPVGDACGEIECAGEWTESVSKAYASRILQRLQSRIPNLKSAILGQAILSPADLERRNINLVGGDPYAGACDLDQFFLFRPLPGFSDHTTPVGRLFHIGASTHPGPGLHGASGYMVAKRLLRRGAGLFNAPGTT